MSKFDAAIADLDNSLHFYNFVATAKGDRGMFRKKKYYLYNQSERDQALLKIPQIEAAIRLLEAAGKVDKNATISFLDRTWDREERLYGEIGLIGSAEHKERKPLRALLVALPED